MIPRAGTSVCLSVLIVVLAAIVLHRPGPARTVAEGVPPKPSGQKPRQQPPSPAPEKRDAATDPVAKVARPSQHLPDSPLTEVRPGETLADVARRVYGDGSDLDALRKINRDQLATPDAEVRAGMILRTPPM